MADNTDNIKDVQNSERLLDLSNQIVDSLNQRRKLIKDIKADENLYFTTVKQQQRLSQDIAANAEKYLGYQIKSKDLAKQIKASSDNANKSTNAFNSIEAKLANQRKQSLNDAISLRNKEKEVRKQIEALDLRNDVLRERRTRALANGASVNSNAIRDIQEEIKSNQVNLKIKERQVKNLQTEGQKQKDIAKTVFETIKNAKEAEIDREKELAFLEKNLIIRKRIERSTGLLGGLAKSLSKIPGIGQYLRADEAIDEMEKLAAKFEEAESKSTGFTNRLQIGLKGASVLAKGFIENIKSPEAIIAFLGNAILKANEQTVALGKSLGVSKNQTIGIREEFVKYSAYADDTFVNTNRLLKSQAELSEQLGIAVQFSGKEAENFARLTELSGLSVDEAGRLAKTSAAVGQEVGDYTDTIREAATYAQRTTKTHFSSKQILQDVSKLSAGILVKFQGNPKALAAAVVQAKALGTNLETIDKIGESLLNFESSIENELKAELITGKQLNMEKARYAALTGDQLTLTKEIASQVGTLNDFENMNVIAQQSLAQAFGLSRSELADMLIQQEAINKYGSEAAKLNKDQVKDFEKQKQSRKGLTLKEYLKEQEQQVTIQDKFNNAILKLQDLIGNLVAGPLSGLIDSLTKGLDLINKIFSTFGKIGSAIKGIFGNKVGEAIGGVASVGLISGLVYLMARSLTKGTALNPMIVKDASAAGGGIGDMIGSSFKGGAGRIGKAFSKGGLKGGGKAMSRILSKTLKGNALTALTMGLGDAALNYGEGKGVGESLGRAGITGLTSLLGGGLGSLIAPGAGTIGGGIAGGMAGDWLGDKIFGEAQPVEDGIASSNQGPFAIRNKYGKTAVTAKGDNVVVSPNVNNIPTPVSQPIPQNVNKSPIPVSQPIPQNVNKSSIPVSQPIPQNTIKESIGINKPIQPTFDTSAITDAISALSNTVSGLINRQQPTPQFALHIDGKHIGTAVGKQMETGTSQLQYTGYKIA